MTGAVPCRLPKMGRNPFRLPGEFSAAGVAAAPSVARLAYDVQGITWAACGRGRPEAETFLKTSEGEPFRNGTVLVPGTR